MNTITDIDPRLTAAEARLGQLINSRFGGHDLSNPRVITSLRKFCNEFGVHCRLRGIDFPKVVVLALPSFGHVCIWPKDATFMDLQVRIKALLVELMAHHRRQPEASELAHAIQEVYPDYGPMMAVHLDAYEAKKRLPIYGPN